MGAQYILENIRSLSRVDSVQKIDKFNLKAVIDGRARHIYTPSNDDYEVTADIVDKAEGLGADLIVCDLWIKPTGAGMGHAKTKGMAVYKSSTFFARLRGDDEV